MHHEPSRLVHDQDVLVLVHDRERDDLRSDGGVLGDFGRDGDRLAAENLVPGPAGRAVDTNLARFDPRFQAAAGVLRQ